MPTARASNDLGPSQGGGDGVMSAAAEQRLASVFEMLVGRVSDLEDQLRGVRLSLRALEEDAFLSGRKVHAPLLCGRYVQVQLRSSGSGGRPLPLGLPRDDVVVAAAAAAAADAALVSAPEADTLVLVRCRGSRLDASLLIGAGQADQAGQASALIHGAGPMACLQPALEQALTAAGLRRLRELPGPPESPAAAGISGPGLHATLYWHLLEAAVCCRVPGVLAVASRASRSATDDAPDALLLLLLPLCPARLVRAVDAVYATLNGCPRPAAMEFTPIRSQRASLIPELAAMCQAYVRARAAADPGSSLPRGMRAVVEAAGQGARHAFRDFIEDQCEARSGHIAVDLQRQRLLDMLNDMLNDMTPDTDA